MCRSPDVNYEELARCTDDFNGAQCKAVCVEAVSMIIAIFYSFTFTAYIFFCVCVVVLPS